MAGFNITGADSIDNNGGAMVLGANTTGMTIGKALTTTTVNGTLDSATIDRAGTIELGASTATYITIGKTTATASTTNIRGKVQFDSQSGSVGQYLKSEGSSIPPTWATLPASTFVPTATTNLNMNGFNINNCQNLNGNTTALNVGTGAGTTSTVIGKSGATTNIQGNVLFGSASGTSGQFLQSQGAGTTPTWVNGAGAWSGTATSNLDMNSIYDIVKARSLDNNAGAINIGGTSATNISIGRSDIPVSISGNTISHNAVTNTLGSSYTNQSIEQTFPSTTTQRESFYVDNVNNSTETCRISVATGATPLVDNTGTMTLTAGTVSLTANTTNLCNTGASSIINCNAQLHPAYAYNATTGVANTGAIGYTKFGTASASVGLTSGSNVTRSTITIDDDGIYLISAMQGVSVTFTGTITAFTSFVSVTNGAGVFQTNIGVASITALTPNASGNIYYLPFTVVYIVIGATVPAPFTFKLQLTSAFTGGTFTSSNSNFRYSITRLA
jgi:hypothetical protein